MDRHCACRRATATHVGEFLAGSILNFPNLLVVRLLLIFVVPHAHNFRAPSLWVLWPQGFPSHHHRNPLTGAGLLPPACTRPACGPCSRWRTELERWWERFEWIYLGFAVQTTPAVKLLPSVPVRCWSCGRKVLAAVPYPFGPHQHSQSLLSALSETQQLPNNKPCPCGEVLPTFSVLIAQPSPPSLQPCPSCGGAEPQLSLEREKESCSPGTLTGSAERRSPCLFWKMVRASKHPGTLCVLVLTGL